MTMTEIGFGVTDPAATKVATLLAEEANDELFLRVAVRPGGCSGFSYEMFFDTETAADDVVVTVAATERPIVVRLDPQSAQMLDGAELDYNDGLSGAGFKVNNPNAQRTCGCGQSFS